MPEPTSNLLFFFGTECTHCHDMDPLLDQLEKEKGVQIERLECWHNDENAQLLAKYDNGLCGGIPFMFNTESQKFICGNCDYETLKNWAEGN